MSRGIISDVQIQGIACAVPDRLVDNLSYSDRFGAENVEKFIAMTGVRKRYVAGDRQCASDLCATAAEKLLDALQWERSSIEAVILVTQSPDYRIPPTACVLQERLGFSEDCLAFDINLGCSGFVYGVWLAATLIAGSHLNRVLLLAGDISNHNLSPDDRSVAMIFGDGGSATALERQAGKKISYCLHTRGKGFRNLIIPAGCLRNRHDYREEPYLNEDGVMRSDLDLYMNGTELFNFTISEIPKSLNEFKKYLNLPETAIDYYFLHQANLFMIKNIARKIGVSMSQIPVSIEEFGNTSVESIPITIVHCLAGQKMMKPLNVILSGFGVGLSWGNLYLELDNPVILPMIFTNDFYKEGEINRK